ncbi:5-methyltetrahydropteroyltriglutamate--homocysteine S-methyltransferase [Bacillus sp. 1P06AnD]|uniref:5-methyltetrahydropteroyltriglutamate-- homocysteine S-methyltransferase n=1 Tax=Bacillus sp. 1P06AnD TaxID=3132208 RepID=UPI0039A2B725
MKSSNLGYPRIGEQREWKKNLEAFWAGKIDEESFLANMDEIRLKGLIKQKDAGLDIIPINDFTFYDHMLDLSHMFNLIPDRYQDIQSRLDTYFSMARGNDSAVASEMTKWFNTNYHYIIPEWNGATLSLVENKPLDAYKKAKKLAGIEGKPVMVGPYTFLSLSKGYNHDQFGQLLNDLAKLYGQVLEELEQEGVKWVQIDEPAFVTHLTEDQIELVENVYHQLHNAAPSVRIMLQTYFDSVEHYESVVSLPVQGIGLDFVHGKKRNLECLQQFGFPQDKVLSAGIIDGRNIWKSDLTEKKKEIDYLLQFVSNDRLWITPSCSLLHVPVTLTYETNIDPTLKGALAFADEKLGEITGLVQSFSNGDEQRNTLFDRASEAIAALNNSPFRNRQDVQSALEAIKEEDFHRSHPYQERKMIQGDFWKLPLFPTTTIGSFPQSPDIRRARRKFKTGIMNEIEYETFIQSQIKRWVDIQEKMDLDVLVHGEFERNDMVEYFGEKLGGFAFSQNAWVQSYGSRCVKPPIIYGDIAFIEPMTVKESVFAQSLTKKPMKGMLTGPVTILNWSFVRDDISRKQVCYQIALALKQEVESLETHNIRMIQVDEPALREGLPLKKGDWKEYLDWSVRAFLLTTGSVQPATQIHTHMCYCDFNSFMDVISALDADIISIETSRSHGDLLLSKQLQGYDKGIGLGVYDIHSPRVPSVEEIVEIIVQYKRTIKNDQIWINPDCGLKTRKEEETIASLTHMVEATKIIRTERDVKELCQKLKQKN